MPKLSTAEQTASYTQRPNIFEGGLDKAIETAIVALEVLDARRLEVLASEAERIAAGGADYRALEGIPMGELLAAAPQHRVLGCLLQETERNLRLLARLAERNRESKGCIPAG